MISSIYCCYNDISVIIHKYNIFVILVTLTYCGECVQSLISHLMTEHTHHSKLNIYQKRVQFGGLVYIYFFTFFCVCWGGGGGGGDICKLSFFCKKPTLTTIGKITPLEGSMYFSWELSVYLLW